MEIFFVPWPFIIIHFEDKIDPITVCTSCHIPCTQFLRKITIFVPHSFFFPSFRFQNIFKYSDEAKSSHTRRPLTLTRNIHPQIHSNKIMSFNVKLHLYSSFASKKTLIIYFIPDKWKTTHERE